MRLFAILILSFVLAACTTQSSLPEDVEITVLDETIVDSPTVDATKRSLDVRLSRRVTEEELDAIARDLKARETDRYDRTFITYYLPGMQPGKGAWATTHYNPDLDVRILGTTVEQEEALSEDAATPESAGRETVGTWRSNQPYQAARISIYREDETLLMEMSFADGSSMKREVTESQISNGTRYDWEGSYGEYYVVTPSGALELWDETDGLFTTYQP